MFRKDKLMIESSGRYGSYERGYKFCGKCQLYFKTASIKCPLCNNVLRARPRKRLKHKERNYPKITPPEEVCQEAEKIKVIIKKREK